MGTHVLYHVIGGLQKTLRNWRGEMTDMLQVMRGIVREWSIRSVLQKCLLRSSNLSEKVCPSA